MTSGILARLAYETSREVFKDPRWIRPPGEPQRLALRLKNLQREETEGLLALWSAEAERDGLGSVQIVVAHDTDVVCDERFLSKPDRSITWYRNNNENGLLYIQTKVESDEQGLESMFTVQDRNYLDGSLRSDSFDPEKRLIAIAWAEAGGQAALPTTLVDALCIVRRSLDNSGNPVPVRNFARFAKDAAQSLLDSEAAAFDAASVRKAVGNALPALGLLPDEDWQVDAQPDRRLITNYRLSDLMDPNGVVDQDPDDLAEVIGAVSFVDADGNPLGQNDIDQWRSMCITFVRERSEESRKQLPFWIYRQVFGKSRASGALGDRIRDEVLERDSSRLAEFDALNVQAGLNRGEPDAARKLVEALPDTDEDALIDLLKPPTQKALRKLAYPRDRRFTSPFILIVELLRRVEADQLRGAEIELRYGRQPPSDPSENASVGLFAFLYGKGLRDLASRTGSKATEVSLSIDPALVDVRPVPALRQAGQQAGDSDQEDTEEESQDEAEDVPAPVEWNGVPVEVTLRSVDDGSVLLSESLRWLPSDIHWLAFGWIMVAAEDAPRDCPLIELPSADFDSLVRSATTRLIRVADLLSSRKIDLDSTGADEPIAAIEELRSDFWKATTVDGLSVDEIDRYLGEWTVLLAAARSQFVPKGVLDLRLQVLLSYDIVHSTNESRALMLWSHPLRLRWLAEYLRETAAVCAAALDCDLRLNSENENYYLDSLENLSPHGLPPLLANSARTLMVPVSERGFSEEYVAIKQDGEFTSSWQADLDDSAAGELAKQVESYLRAHPHKADGLSLVFILPAGGTVPQRLVSSIRAKDDWKSLPVRCLVIAPKGSWDALVEKFEHLETESRVGGARLSPPLQLELIDWVSEADAAKALGQRQFDIAIVPNFFGDRVAVDEYSEPPMERPGSHQVLHDECTYADRDSDPGSVSIVLRPGSPDPVLEDWSTTNVRLLRRGAISPNSPENIDYVKLNIRFEEAGDLFAALHECCHWVITLDRYIGRHQIESLQPRPDVLTVKDSVGQSGLFTIVVSSNAGRKFVIQRLSRKLKRISRSVPDLDLHALATKVYDEIRLVAPSLILRSMGISRITEEVLGIMVAKRIAERLRPSPSISSVWISLDEHTEWFGGSNSVRADLCRVDIFRRDGRLQLGLVVLEGKLRQAYDRYGEQQALRTSQLLREALSTAEESSDDGGPADALFWRHAILGAVGEVAGSADGDLESGDSVFGDVTRSEILDGQYDLDYCEPVYSICMYEKQTPLSQEDRRGVTVVQSSSAEILDLIQGDLASLSALEPDSTEDLTDESDQPKEDGCDQDLGSEGDTHGGGDLPTNRSVSEGESMETSRDGLAVRRGMPEEKLRANYQLILDTLADFKVEVLLPDDGKPLYVEGPAFVQYRVRPGRGVDPKRINACEGALRVALALEEGKLLRFPIGGGTVNIEVPKEEIDRYYIEAADLWRRWTPPVDDALVVPIGVNQRDEVVQINFSSSNSPHLLIGGTTGSGKSEALNTILYGLTEHYAPNRLNLVLVDPKRTEMVDFDQSPHLLGQIGFDVYAAIDRLTEADAEMERRYQLFNDRRVRDLPQYNAIVSDEERIPRQVIVLDEYADLVSDQANRRTLEGVVTGLAAKARSAGIHLVIATQKPSAESISTTIRSNLPAQLALRCRSATESRIVIGESGAETLNGKGDAFLRIADRLERVQCAKVGPIGAV